MDQLLINAAEKGNLKKVKFALKNGANVNTYNNTLLQSAIKSRHPETVKVLIKNGINVDIKGCNMFLYWIVTTEHLKIMKILLKNHINVHKCNNRILFLAKIYTPPKIIKSLKRKILNKSPFIL